MKKVKVTFWLLGFGCGIALAGMIGTLLSLRIDAIVQYTNIAENNRVDEIREENQEDATKQNAEESSADLVLSDADKEQLSTNEAVESNREEPFVDDHTSTISTEQEVTEKLYEVFIPNNSSASEICTILEEVGIVESGEDFLAYIREHKKQTRLKDGSLQLPMLADYETLLALLLT